MGEPTFGKGTVQNLVDLDAFSRENPGLGHLKITVAQFFRIAGGSTQHKGVVPDIAFPVTWDATEYGESVYDNALPWAAIAPAKFDSYGDFKPMLPLLKSKHEARIAQDQEFQWWIEDVNEYRELRERKTLSLNEATRRAEREREEARRTAREAQRKALGQEVDEDAVATLDDGLQADEQRGGEARCAGPRDGSPADRRHRPAACRLQAGGASHPRYQPAESRARLSGCLKPDPCAPSWASRARAVAGPEGAASAHGFAEPTAAGRGLHGCLRARAPSPCRAAGRGGLGHPAGSRCHPAVLLRP
jgi:hypothetical protein